MTVLIEAPQERGGDPTLLRDEIRHIIETAILGHPRSLQERIGPSEIGTPCDRRLAYKLAGVPRAREERPGWRSTVGTAVHAWLADVLAAHNRQIGMARFLVEEKVDVGDIDDEAVFGSVDCYDAMTCTVLDWKIVGPTSLRAYKGGPGKQYLTQVQLYARGRERQGLPVDTVAIFFLPANGELSDAVFWHAPYDENIAVEALARATRIMQATKLVDAATVLPLLPTADAHCHYCPWFSPGAREIATACPGHPTRTTRVDPLHSLIPARTRRTETP